MSLPLPNAVNPRVNHLGGSWSPEFQLLRLIGCFGPLLRVAPLPVGCSDSTAIQKAVVFGRVILAELSQESPHEQRLVSRPLHLDREYDLESHPAQPVPIPSKPFGQPSGTRKEVDDRDYSVQSLSPGRRTRVIGRLAAPFGRLRQSLQGNSPAGLGPREDPAWRGSQDRPALPSILSSISANATVWYPHLG